MADLSRKLSLRKLPVRQPSEADMYSIIALNFSAALDDIFNLDSSEDLARTVEQK